MNNATGPGSQYEGRVEVFWHGEWGTVCSNGWNWEDANVVCVMVGFQTAVRPVTDGRFGPGQPIHTALYFITYIFLLCVRIIIGERS